LRNQTYQGILAVIMPCSYVTRIWDNGLFAYLRGTSRTSAVTIGFLAEEWHLEKPDRTIRGEPDFLTRYLHTLGCLSAFERNRVKGCHDLRNLSMN
jgi:hypothetical protein